MMRVTQRLFRHWGLKLLALSLSLLLYLAITGQPRSEVGLTAPVVFRDLPAGMEITNPRLHRVEIRLIGPADLITRAAYTAISISVNLNRAHAGRHPVYLTAADVSVPFDLKVASIRPETLSIDLERVLTVRVSLWAQPRGAPAAGYRFQGSRLHPRWVYATGPAPDLARLHAIPVPLDISGLRSTTTLPLLPANPDPVVRLHIPPGAFARVRIASSHAAGARRPQPRQK